MVDVIMVENRFFSKRMDPFTIMDESLCKVIGDIKVILRRQNPEEYVFNTEINKIRK